METASEQAAREVIRPLVGKFIAEGIRNLLVLAQSREAADKIAATIWPSMARDALLMLAAADPDYLICSAAVPSCLGGVIIEQFMAAVPTQVEELAKKNQNKFAEGGKLKKIVRKAVERHEQATSDLAHQLFDKIQRDRLADPELVRSLVIRQLNNLCIEELFDLASAGGSADEAEAKRHLKALTALSALPAGVPVVKEILSRLTDGRTADLPYVLKYLSVDHTPEHPSFPVVTKASADCITTELEKLIPEATPLKAALESYLKDGGIISKLLSSSSALAPSLSKKFEDLPIYIPSSPSGIVLPKQQSLEVYRERRYSLPDGIVCAVALAILLESILRQLQSSLYAERSPKERPKKLLDRLKKRGGISLSADTLDHLEIVFGTSQIALRDAVAHGVFIANDEQAIAKIVGGLTRTVELLMQDIAAAGKLGDFYSAKLWCEDQHYCLDAKHEETFREQFEGSNMILQSETADIHRHMLRVINALIPDKVSICRAPGLIWANMDSESSGKFHGDPAAEMVGLLGALISIEELFRAVQEVYGQRVLWPEGQRATMIMCRLSMLEEKASGLLDPVTLRRLFGAQLASVEFQKSIAAVQSLRDNLLHGGWGGLVHPKIYYIHLVVKLILTVCTAIGFDPSGKPVPVGGH